MQAWACLHAGAMHAGRAAAAVCGCVLQAAGGESPQELGGIIHKLHDSFLCYKPKMLSSFVNGSALLELIVVTSWCNCNRFSGAEPKSQRVCLSTGGILRQPVGLVREMRCRSSNRHGWLRNIVNQCLGSTLLLTLLFLILLQMSGNCVERRRRNKDVNFVAFF